MRATQIGCTKRSDRVSRIASLSPSTGKVWLCKVLLSRPRPRPDMQAGFFSVLREGQRSNSKWDVCVAFEVHLQGAPDARQYTFSPSRERFCRFLVGDFIRINHDEIRGGFRDFSHVGRNRHLFSYHSQGLGRAHRQLSLFIPIRNDQVARLVNDIVISGARSPFVNALWTNRDIRQYPT